MVRSSCTISFFRNDLQRTRLQQGKCPVKNCHYKKPFCSEHGLRIHRDTFVYENGRRKEDKKTAIKRNLMFNPEYYIANILYKSGKVGAHKLCHENSEDAVTYNVFTALLADKIALKQLASSITKEEIYGELDLCLWGNKIDLKNNRCVFDPSLKEFRDILEKNKGIKTEPDIMLVASKKLVICIEAKFGSKNLVAEKKEQIVERYYTKNEIIKEEKDKIFDLHDLRTPFYEQLFRNLVFAASMVKLAGTEMWYVVNLRSQHIMNLKKGEPESLPVVRNIRSILKPKYKKRFLHLTWEEIYDKCVRGNASLHNLSWYMKNKTLNCRRAFNIL